ncbi:MAG: hypothetical protein LQ342_001109 [Letrouitia transgressa]|nr:MAG: hypothetical protein LQ342_001109 [Letrouitia transgressa]
MSQPAVKEVTEAVSFVNLEASKRTKEAGWVDRVPYEYGNEAPTWAGNAARYEWKDDFGDVGPEDQELEKMLFKDEHRVEAGDQMDKIVNIKVTVESENRIPPIAKFDDAGLHPVVLQNVRRCGFNIPTPVQTYCLPALLLGLDVIGIAQTGSGKTAAYLIPTISKLMGKAKKLCAPRPNVAAPDFDVKRDGMRAEPLILIVAPARELATQIFDEARRLCYRSMFRPCVVYGGAPKAEQANQLRMGCDILVATPGRLLDFLQSGSTLSLRRLKYVSTASLKQEHVSDRNAADEMVASDWSDDMATIMSGADANQDSDHVYCLFSATFPKEARALAKEYLSTDHIRIRVGRAGSTTENITQKIIYVDDAKKRDCIFDLLLSMPPSRTLVFVNSRREADYLDDYLYNRGMPTTSIHGDRTQREREDAIRAFKSGKAPVLIATDVSARGLDIKNVFHVINYQLPSVDHGGISEYVHRIGRTARIGNIGLATSFYNERNEDLAEDLVRLLLENGQDVPNFLQDKKPEDLNFNDDTDNEGENGTEKGNTGDSAWGDNPGNAAPGGTDGWD